MSIQVQINRVSDFGSNITKVPTDYCELVGGEVKGYNDWFVEIETEKLGDFLLGLEDHEQCSIAFRKGDNTVEIMICDVL
jgi:hypothetical protein